MDTPQKSLDVKIAGMSCVMCSTTIKNALISLEGVENADVNHANGTARISFSSDPVETRLIGEAIENAGYTFLGTDEGSTTELENALRKKELSSKRNRFIAGITGGLAVMALMHTPLPWGIPLELVLLVFSLPIFLYTSLPIFSAAYRSLIHKNLSMDVMYAMGIGVSYGSSILGTAGILSKDFLFYETALMLAGFLMLGRFLETRARGKTTDTIKKLMSLNPDRAILLKDGNEIEIAAEELKKGDIFIVKPGIRIPADGEISAGEGFVDESTLTGESIPVFKKTGDTVSGGTLNTDGVLTVTARRVGRDTVLARIISMVREAQGTRPPVQRIADRVVSYFIPVILIIAFTAFVIWYLIVGESLLFSLSILIAILVIACPCALGLATPTAITVGIGRGAELGILIRDGDSLESAAKLSAVVFDKTGTLTRGEPRVTSIRAFRETPEALIRYAASMEKNSSHPIALAVIRKAEELGIETVSVEAFRNFPGKGVTGIIDNHTVLVGNRPLIEQHGLIIDPAVDREITGLFDRGETVLICAHNNIIIGIIGVSDTVKPDSASAVRELKKRGLSVAMITGDNRRTALSVAGQLNIETVISEVLPGNKAEAVHKLQSNGKRVAFVGDGVNDAPALTTADLGIALSRGTDIAVESGKMVLMRDSLIDVVAGLELSRKVFDRIKQNIFWAFAYNTILIPVAAGLLYPLAGITFRPEFAGLAMALSSVTVVSLSLLLRKFIPPVYRTNPVH